jgi:transcriptional regulator with XRE-family HTH domain
MSDPAIEQRKELEDIRSRLLKDDPGLADEVGRIEQAESRRHVLIRHMARFRAERKLSQADVAERMATSQPAIARLEAGLLDPRLSTLERYAAAIGYDLNLVGAADVRLSEGAPEATFSEVAQVGGRWKNDLSSSQREVLQFLAEKTPHDMLAHMTVQPAQESIKLNVVGSVDVFDAMKRVLYRLKEVGHESEPIKVQVDIPTKGNL